MFDRAIATAIVFLCVAACEPLDAQREPAAVDRATVESHETFAVIVNPSVPLDASTPVERAGPVRVLQTTHLDRPSEVVGIVDVHTPMGGQDAALEALRRKAASMGADAVVGVEFHHGEGAGEPTHLSGLAVRFVGSSP